MAKTQITREQWLLHAAALIRKDVAKRGVVVPPVAISCSWPGAGSMHTRIGECWPRAASKAKLNELFISPKMDDAAQVVGVLCHEMAHAVLNCAHGHKAPFVQVAAVMGCVGKPTTMVPPAAVSQAWVDKVAKRYGPFPHRAVDRAKSGQKKQGTRMLKLQCMNADCGAVWRMSAKWADQATVCPCCVSDAIGQEQAEGEE